MFGLGKKSHREISPSELHDLLGRRAALLVDVREPDEFAAVHIPGAVNLPLSSFSPRNVPDAGDRTIVLHCAGGKRSGMALDLCAKVGATVDSHLAGGMAAWKAAGLPLVRG
jgi:rhodanese-related sulfurtransferase